MLKKFYFFIASVICSRNIIIELAVDDFKRRYFGSYLGIVWAFLNPLATILVFWFIFDLGFKSKPVEDVPFILWLVCGIIPWFYFLDSWSSASTSIIENSYLVSKVVFRVSTLPLVKILSALWVHLFLLFVSILFFLFYGRVLGPTLLQLGYYLLGMVALLLGLSWLTSSLTVFIRDLGHFLAIFLQLLFWVTPILWPLKLLPEQYHVFIKLNPVYYIVQGYRDCFIYGTWFWEKPGEMVYFWTVTGILFFVGGYSFSRLRPHFADVI